MNPNKSARWRILQTLILAALIPAFVNCKQRQPDPVVWARNRVILPPLDFQTASPENLIATWKEAYQTAAGKSGNTAADLHIDLAGARTDLPFTGSSPEGDSMAVLRYLAAVSGNSMTGSTPDFRWNRIAETEPGSGGIVIPPNYTDSLSKFLSHLKEVERTKAGPDPFAPDGAEKVTRYDRHDAFRGSRAFIELGIVGPEARLTMHDGVVEYENISPLDRAKLGEFLSLIRHSGD